MCLTLLDVQFMIDGLGRVLCMSEINDSPAKPTDALQFHRNKQKDAHSKTKKVKTQELKYNKFEAPPPVSFDGGNHCNNVGGGAQQAFLYQQHTPAHVSNQNPLARNQQCAIEAGTCNRSGGGGGGGAYASTLEGDVREIKRMLRQYISRLNDSEHRTKINKEWRIVARVLDRVFFFTYVAVIVISLATIFPKG